MAHRKHCLIKKKQLIICLRLEELKASLKTSIRFYQCWYVSKNWTNANFQSFVCGISIFKKEKVDIKSVDNISVNWVISKCHVLFEVGGIPSRWYLSSRLPRLQFLFLGAPHMAPGLEQLIVSGTAASCTHTALSALEYQTAVCAVTTQPHAIFCGRILQPPYHTFG